MFGGDPFGALIGDYEFGKHPEDIELLEKMSQVAAAAHAPFLIGGRAGADEPGQLHQPRPAARPGQDLRHHRVRQVEVVPPDRRFALRGADACRTCCCGCPMASDTKPVDGFNYEEGVDGTDHSKYLWGNAA